MVEIVLKRTVGRIICKDDLDTELAMCNIKG